jgi:hypothetical protein
VLAAAAGALPSACRGEPMGAVGMSTNYGSSSPGARPGDGGVRRESPLPAGFRDHMTRVAARQASRGHGEGFEGAIWANDLARDAWLAGKAMPDGAALVEDAARRADQADAGLFYMEKQPGGWRFAAVGADGDVADEAPRVARCAECHAQAPLDGVFRVPAVDAGP